jgi:hypothetical protein
VLGLLVKHTVRWSSVGRHDAHAKAGAMAFACLLAMLPCALYAIEPEPHAESFETASVSDERQTDVTASEDVTEEQDQDCIRRDEAGRFQGWMDYQHCVFSGRTATTAQWVDDLFGDWSDDRADMMAWVVGETGWDEELGWSSSARVRARVNLPNAKARLRLIIADEGGVTDSTQNERSSPKELAGVQESTSIALRWIPRIRHHVRSDFDVGVRGGPEVFARLRLRRQWGLTDNSILKLGQTFRYGTESSGVSTSRLELERAITEHSVVRFGSVYLFKENEHPDGFLWSNGVSMSHAFHDWRDASLGYGFSVSGHTQPDHRKESYGPWLLWRQSAWRDWIYYEIEPRLTQYRALKWDMVPSVTFRLEARFGHYEKK